VFGSWGTSLPAKARARIAKSRQGRPTITPEILIPCGDLLSPWNERDPERSDGVVEHWSFQHSNTPLLHHSGSLIFHRVRMSEPTVSTVGLRAKGGRVPQGRLNSQAAVTSLSSWGFSRPHRAQIHFHQIDPAFKRLAIFDCAAGRKSPTRRESPMRCGSESRGPGTPRLRRPSPGGTPENSPPFQRWVSNGKGAKPRGGERKRGAIRSISFFPWRDLTPFTPFTQR
jgi:hypothetical protein